MPSKAQISIPLIIDGVDVYLTDEQFTFSPQSQSDSSIANGRVLAQGADTASCHAAVDSCARAFDTWRRMSASQRRTHFLCLAELLRAKETEIRRIIEEEIYATSMWSQINFDDSVLLIEEMAALVTSHVLSGTIPQAQDPESQALVLTEPLGVILWIAPWNSPLVLGFRAVAGAIAAGNTAILKGSELSPRTHYFIVSLFREAGFPPGVCNFLLHCESDGAHVFATIIDRHEVRKCNFTGSTPVGRMIASRAAKALKPSLLELGGKNFAVVLEDADVDKTARLIAEGAFLNNVFSLTHPYSLHFDETFSLLSRLLRTAPVVSRIITMKSAARIRAILADAELKGATLHTALQNTNNTSALFPTGTAVIPATLVEGILPTMDLYGQEYFGPLLSIISVDSVEKVVSIVNECQYGLSAAIHTKNHYEALFLAERLKVGAVHVNGATVHDESTLPHGGHGDSGWGRFGAGWGLSEFVHTKTVVFNK